jgi:hypothetical protein
MSAGIYHGTYAAEKVIITFNNVIITGFTDGDFITAKYDEERYYKVKGTDGEVGRSRNPSRAGVVEVVLMATSPVNKELSDLLTVSEVSKVAPISVQDLSGNSLVFASKSWIKSAPDFVRGKEVGETKWTFDCADLEMYYDGTTDNSLASLIGI